MEPLSDDKRREIQAHLREGVLTQVAIAKLVGVHESTVSRIKSRPAEPESKINWGDKVRLILAGFMHFGISISAVARNCSASARNLQELWSDINRNAYERTYRALGYAATRLFPDSQFNPDLQLHRLEAIGRTIQQAMGSLSWAVAAKRITWIQEHGVDVAR